jgi:hypothetical protein
MYFWGESGGISGGDKTGVPVKLGIIGHHIFLDNKTFFSIFLGFFSVRTQILFPGSKRERDLHAIYLPASDFASLATS